VLYPQLLPDRWLWGPVGLQGAATAWLVAALTWIYTKRQVQSRPKAEDASGASSSSCWRPAEKVSARLYERS